MQRRMDVAKIIEQSVRPVPRAVLLIPESIDAPPLRAAAVLLQVGIREQLDAGLLHPLEVIPHQRRNTSRVAAWRLLQL